MLTSSILLIVFLSGGLAVCPNPAVLSIIAPQKMEALSGSCLRIPCRFTPKDGGKFSSTKESFGVWIKEDPKFGTKIENVIFNSSGAVKTYPMKITGNLSQKNCTTLFYNLTGKYTDLYYFRVENVEFTATASCDPVKINVNDSPQRPRIEISGDVKDLKEKESVTITCSAFTPCPHSPPELTWNLQQDSHRHTEENTDGTFTTKIQQDITLSDTHDGYNVTCSASYPVIGGNRVKTSETEETLSVSYAPKDTSASISPSGLVSAGSWVNLSCSSRAKPPVSSFTWFRIGTFRNVKVADGRFYSFNATDGGVYYCVAANDLGSQTSSRLDVNGEMDQSSLWGAAGGVITVIILLICLVFLFRWLKSKHPTSHQSQSLVLQEPASAVVSPDIHYGEIDFSKLRPSSDLIQNGTQGHDVVYSQLKVNVKTESCVTQTDIYAHVKKK